MEKQWMVGPISVDGQKLILKYRLGDGSPVVIEYYAHPDTPTGVNKNCFGEGGERVVGPEDAPVIVGATQTVLGGPTAFDIMASTPTLGQMELDISFNSDISTFVGYDDTADPTTPTGEFCVKVIMGGSVFSQLAVKYTFKLDGKIEFLVYFYFNRFTDCHRRNAAATSFVTMRRVALLAILHRNSTV
jgi:hypothetical protein